MQRFLLECVLGLEPNLENRIKAAKARARKIANQDVQTEDDLRDFLIYYISSKYNLPIFSEYFGNRTIDDLIYEAELLAMKDRPPERVASDITNENKAEADSLFDDWVKEDQWMDLPPPSSEAFDEAAKQFMQTGNFKE